MRRALSFIFTTVVFLVACSGGSSGGDGDAGAGSSGSSGASSGSSGASSGSSGTPGPSARMIVTTNGGSEGACLPVFKVGSFEPLRPVDDNTKDGDALVRVQCTVAPAGDGYLVHAAATVDGLGAFAFDVKKLPSNGTLTGTPSEVAIGWGNADAGYRSDGSAKCAVDTTFSPSAGIAPGRYWAVFSCTGLMTSAGSKPCAVAGEVRLENCAQSL